MVLTNEHVSFAQKVKTSVSTLCELVSGLHRNLLPTATVYPHHPAASTSTTDPRASTSSADPRKYFLTDPMFLCHRRRSLRRGWSWRWM